jgi:hypothetical protein
MTGTPARSPQPVTRRDGTTAWSSGAVHTLLIRAADLLHRPASPEIRANIAETSPGPKTEHDLYQQAFRAVDSRN